MGLMDMGLIAGMVNLEGLDPLIGILQVGLALELGPVSGPVSVLVVMEVGMEVVLVVILEVHMEVDWAGIIEGIHHSVGTLAVMVHMVVVLGTVVRMAVLPLVVLDMCVIVVLVVQDLALVEVAVMILHLVVVMEQAGVYMGLEVGTVVGQVVLGLVDIILTGDEVFNRGC
jgi:hypothetical protein